MTGFSSNATAPRPAAIRRDRQRPANGIFSDERCNKEDALRSKGRESARTGLSAGSAPEFRPATQLFHYKERGVEWGQRDNIFLRVCIDIRMPKDASRVTIEVPP